MPNNAHPLPDAPLWRRLAALVYDAFLLFGLLMLFGYVAVAIESAWLGTSHIEQSPTAGGNPVVFLGMIGVVTSFYSLFWLRNRQTLGMQAWRLELDTADGTPLQLRHCLLRLAAALLSWSCAGLGYLWCLLPPRQTWHDRLSGTRVVVHEKRS